MSSDKMNMPVSHLWRSNVTYYVLY